MRKNVDLSGAFSYLQTRKGAQETGQREHLGPNAGEGTGGGLLRLRMEQVAADPKQPRQTFVDESLEELAESIRAQGVLQPILVRPEAGGRYRIVAGERRFRAAKLAGLAEVPCVAREFSDDEALAVGLIENVHREDLTDIDKSDALRRLKEMTGKGWEEIADAVQLSHARVRTLASLQTLAEPVKEAIRTRRLAGRVARVLKPLPEALQVELLEEALGEALSAEVVQARAKARQEVSEAAETACSPRATKMARRHAVVKRALDLARAMEAAQGELTEAERQVVEEAALRVLALVRG